MTTMTTHMTTMTMTTMTTHMTTMTITTMRITTMIKQIIKKNKLALAENNIDDFIDVAREKKLSLRSEEEITRALNILINSEIFIKYINK